MITPIAVKFQNICVMIKNLLLIKMRLAETSINEDSMFEIRMLQDTMFHFSFLNLERVHHHKTVSMRSMQLLTHVMIISQVGLIGNSSLSMTSQHQLEIPLKDLMKRTDHSK